MGTEGIGTLGSDPFLLSLRQYAPFPALRKPSAVDVWRCRRHPRATERVVVRIAMKRIDLIRHLETHGCRLLREGANRGTGVATLGARVSPVSAGATIYIPRHVQISLRNTGTEPLGVAFIFSKPGFEELMRDNSVREGQPVTPISAEERDQIRKRHSGHTIYPPPR
ncbi:MAG: hypothetical protein ABJB74_15910 [Gemmatimonas sp.]